jgi:hypothetical protein
MDRRTAHRQKTAAATAVVPMEMIRKVLVMDVVYHGGQRLKSEPHTPAQIAYSEI